MARYAQLIGCGKYVPERVLTNRELEKSLDTADHWIRERTGISARRIAADYETASSMGVAAAHQALERAGIASEELDLVIVATVTPEMVLPACASVIQYALGATKAGAFDLNAGCSGFVYTLATATQFIRSGMYDKVLVVGSEVFSRILDWEDRSTCVLFGDGAGAVVLRGSEEPGGMMSCVLGSDGSGADLLYLPGPAVSPLDQRKNGKQVLRMKGNDVFRFAVEAMTQATREAIQQAGLHAGDIKLFVPHQANERIIRAAARSAGIPRDRIFLNVERYGNTSAASIPIALCEAQEEGRLDEGDYVVLVGFGSGLSWAATVVQWSLTKASPPPHRALAAASGLRRWYSEALQKLRLRPTGP